MDAAARISPPAVQPASPTRRSPTPAARSRAMLRESHTADVGPAPMPRPPAPKSTTRRRVAPARGASGSRFSRRSPNVSKARLRPLAPRPCLQPRTTATRRCPPRSATSRAPRFAWSCPSRTAERHPRRDHARFSSDKQSDASIERSRCTARVPGSRPTAATQTPRWCSATSPYRARRWSGPGCAR